jgi:hypothetical protein
MRPVRQITDEEEGFRLEPHSELAVNVIRKNPVEPEPIGTIILRAYRIVGYTPDCDGSLIARVVPVDRDGKPLDAEAVRTVIYPDRALVVTEEELRSFFHGASDGETGEE